MVALERERKREIEEGKRKEQRSKEYQSREEFKQIFSIHILNLDKKYSLR